MGAKAWLDLYQAKQLSPQAAHFPRAGLIRQALVLDFSESSPDGVELASRGFGGQVVNLDLYQLAAVNAERLGFSLSIPVSPLAVLGPLIPGTVQCRKAREGESAMGRWKKIDGRS